MVFEDTYKEYFMQAQQFDQLKQYNTFRELLEKEPKADRMHNLVSTAAIGYLRQLNGLIPEVTNTSGKLFLPFSNFRFELLQSHIKDKSQHKVVIYFYSDHMVWLDTIDRFMLLANSNQTEALEASEEVETELLEIVPNLSISSVKHIHSTVTY